MADKTNYTERGPLSPRGAERTARRAKQAANKTQADQDALLTPPAGSAKAAAKTAAAQTQVARFGTSERNVRKTAQNINKVQADKEAVTLAAPIEEPNPVAGLVPGQQPTLLQLRRLAKAQQGVFKDEATEAGKIAGKAVRDVLLNRAPRLTPHRRHRTVAAAQSALQQAAANGHV